VNRYLTVGEVVEINAEVVRKFGGRRRMLRGMKGVDFDSSFTLSRAEARRHGEEGSFPPGR